MSGNAAESVLDVIAKARKDFDVVITEGTALLLDIDDDFHLHQYERMMEKFADQFDLQEQERWRSKSGGTHIVVKCGNYLDPVERIALQACLGSDPIREMLGFKHVENGIDEFSFLFRPRSAA